ncbi:MAG: family 20 glycosylhydrolase [Acidobacteria bacterium]|nr:family 20 glycosylhydrolase [Acidobacteriota bacterium]
MDRIHLNPEQVEYMMFPRTIALAEALWTRRA